MTDIILIGAGGNCKKVIDIILASNILEFLKFFTPKNIIKNEQPSPKKSEYNPIKLAKIYFSSNAFFTSGGI